MNNELRQGMGYQFHANSRIVRLENLVTGDIQTFGYDGINRLTQANGSQTGPAGFLYDANHNRRERTGTGFTETLTNNPTNNQLQSITGPLPRQYSYRPTGELQSIFGAADRISESSFETPLRNATLSYDRFNRLKQVSGQNLVANYKISANDRRVEKSVRGITQFVYAQNGQLLYERDLETNRPGHHLYFQGQPIGLVRNGILYRAQTDHLGRPEALVTNDASSTTVWRSLLLAFDRQVINDQIGGYHLGFPGQYHDEETGFIQNNYRDYDTATGRYLQLDPIGLAGGVNPYGYVASNPLAFTDVNGLSADNDWQDIPNNPNPTNCEKESTLDFLVNLSGPGAYVKAALDVSGFELNLFEGDDRVEVGDYDEIETPLAATGYLANRIAGQFDRRAESLRRGALDRTFSDSVRRGRINRAEAVAVKGSIFSRAGRFLGPIGAMGQLVLDVKKCECKK